MKAKQLITAGLLVFVAVSIIAVVAREFVAPPRTGGEDVVASDDPFAGEDRMVAVYFHGNTRCKTCLTIESYAHEAIMGETSGGPAFGWKVTNYEKPGNEHFAKEYGLIAPTVMLVAVEDGKAARRENLTRVWELVMAGDKEAFIAYVEEQAQLFARS